MLIIKREGLDETIPTRVRSSAADEIHTDISTVRQTQSDVIPRFRVLRIQRECLDETLLTCVHLPANNSAVQ